MAKFDAYSSNASPDGADILLSLDVSDVSEDPSGKTKKLTIDGLLAVSTTVYATAAQGALADSATQPGDLGTAATTAATDYATAAQGTLADSATQPGDLGTAATTAATDYATAAQGALADSATQPGDLGTAATTAATDYATTAQGALAATALQQLVGDATPELGGQLDALTYGIVGLGDVVEEVSTANVTGAYTLVDGFGIYDLTMTADSTLTFPTAPASGDGTSFLLILRGAFTPTLPATVDWAGGTPPAYVAALSMYAFTTVDGGAMWLGVQAGAGFA